MHAKTFLLEQESQHHFQLNICHADPDPMAKGSLRLFWGQNIFLKSAQTVSEKNTLYIQCISVTLEGGFNVTLFYIFVFKRPP